MDGTLPTSWSIALLMRCVDEFQPQNDGGSLSYVVSPDRKYATCSSVPLCTASHRSMQRSLRLALMHCRSLCIKDDVDLVLLPNNFSAFTHHHHCSPLQTNSHHYSYNSTPTQHMAFKKYTITALALLAILSMSCAAPTTRSHRLTVAEVKRKYNPSSVRQSEDEIGDIIIETDEDIIARCKFISFI